MKKIALVALLVVVSFVIFQNCDPSFTKTSVQNSEQTPNNNETPDPNPPRVEPPEENQQTVLGMILWSGESLDYIGVNTLKIAGCRQNSDGVFWDLEACRADCDPLRGGKVDCGKMCSLISSTFTTSYDNDTLCLQEQTIAAPQANHVELGRIFVDNTSGELGASGTHTSNLQGCRQNESQVYWNDQDCLADCGGLGPGGLNCRRSCNLMKADAVTTDEELCTFK